MEDLKRIYRQAAAGRALALDAALAALGTEPAEAGESIRRIAHSLRGSGATYGFPEVSAAAARAEDAAGESLAAEAAALLEVLRTLAQESAPPPARVLVVDDDPEMQLLLRVVLTRPGRELEIAGTAAEAQALLASGPFDLILLDLLLPDADGRKVLLRIRELPQAASTPVFVLSAKTTSHTRMECFALGADGFFDKPFDPELIASAVDGLLNRGSRDPAELRAARAELRFASYVEYVTEQLRRCREQAHALSVVALRPILSAGSGRSVRERPLDFLERVDGALVKLLGERSGRGGEQVFFALYPGESPARALALARALREDLRAALRQRKGERVPQFIGAVAEAGPHEEPRQLLARAEGALQAAGESHDLFLVDQDTARDQPILVVEDDELVASILKHRLERDGFTIVHCTDGVEALAEIERGGHALVILDVKLPGMDGFELLERLRREPGRARTPVIMLTAMGAERDVVRGLELGANDYIVKPFSPVELIARVHRVLGR